MKNMLKCDVNGRLGAILFWMTGNDGLTYWERRQSYKRYLNGIGAPPTREQSERVYKFLSEGDHGYNVLQFQDDRDNWW